MYEWTDSARDELSCYLDEVTASLDTAGVDAAEVVEDLRAHVDREVKEAGLTIVTAENVAHILAKMGKPDMMAGTSVPETKQPPLTRNKRRKKPLHAGLHVAFVFGIILPIVALIVELLTGMSRSIFVDPVPTMWHVLLVALVPVANLAVYLRIRRGAFKASRWPAWLNSLGIGVAIYYSIIFVPISLFAVFGILYLGIGFLPLSPLASLLSAFSLRRKLKVVLAEEGGQRLPGVWRSVLLVLLVMVLIASPTLITRVGLQMTVAEQSSVRVKGLRLLRTAGNEELMLRACYRRNRAVMDVATFVMEMVGPRVSAQQAQAAYYRATGTPHNAVRPPEMRGFRTRMIINSDEWDFGQGGDAVASRVKGLNLQESIIDTKIDERSATTYTEWILIFKNDSNVQREARTLIALPPGAVASRVTLWIDGEEREAAYGGRSQVKEAYKRVVQRRRDPVLVTTSGPDQVLLQCFPVPPNGGTMKTKIGITAPLVLKSRDKGYLAMPYFREHNFGVPEDVRHSVWIEGQQGAIEPTVVVGSEVTNHGGEANVLRAKLSHDDLTLPFSVKVTRDPSEDNVWARALDDSGDVVLQAIETVDVSTPRKVAIVIDGSRRMARFADALSESLAHLPEHIECSLILASDEPQRLLEPGPASKDRLAQAGEMIRQVDYVGGCDNVPALQQAWEMVAGNAPAAILWLHATQPVDFIGVEELLQNWTRRPGNPILYDAQFGPGPNKVSKKLSGMAPLRRAPNFGDPATGLKWLFAIWSGNQAAYGFERILSPQNTGRPTGVEGSSHIARLWAYHEVARLMKSDEALAVALAKKYQLVTPVTGAVVLETAEQYAQAGLEPSDGSNSPHIAPEPETWMLLGVGVLLIGCHAWRRRRAPRTTCGHL